MGLIEAVNILLLEKEVKEEELKAFPDNYYLKRYINALDVILEIITAYIAVCSFVEKHKLKK